MNNSTSTFVDPFEAVNKNIIGQIFVVIVGVTIFVFGNIFHIGIIAYEHFGEDPMKRSLLNQVRYLIKKPFSKVIFDQNTYYYYYFVLKFTSYVCESIVLYNIICVPLLIWRNLVGPFNYGTALFFLLWRNFVSYLSIWSLLESIIVRYLGIVVWKRPPPFEENFVAAYMRFANILVALNTLIVDSHGHEFHVSLGRYLGRERFPEEMEGLIPFR
jgi:hypothetical protein